MTTTRVRQRPTTLTTKHSTAQQSRAQHTALTLIAKHSCTALPSTHAHCKDLVTLQALTAASGVAAFELRLTLCREPLFALLVCGAASEGSSEAQSGPCP